MTLFRIVNTSGRSFPVPRPVSRMLADNAAIEVDINASELDNPSFAADVAAGHIAVTRVTPNDVPDALETPSREEYNVQVTQYNEQVAVAGVPVEGEEVPSTGTTPVVLLTIPVPEDTTVLVSARVLGHYDDHSDGAAYILHAAFKNDGGTVTQLGTTSSVALETTAGLNATLAASGTNAVVSGVGIAATNITWKATAEVNTLG